MAKEHTWIESIKRVLASSKGAMHYKDIADQIVALDLRQNLGATPAALVATTLSTSITKDGDDSPLKGWTWRVHVSGDSWKALRSS